MRDPLGVSPIGVAPRIILANNPNRLAFIIMNLSANVVYIDLEQTVNAGAGIEQGMRLDANGGFVSMVWNEDFQMVGWAWWGVSAAAATILTILEVVEE
ncbi:hypothetical protein ES708_24107 [subsurface metagenome]